jgi:hypothetical protein
MGARVGVPVDFNDGVAVVDAEVGSSFSEERIKRRQ